MHNMDTSVSAALKATFKEEISDSSESHFLHRLHCVLLVTEGCSYQQVAEWFGIHQRKLWNAGLVILRNTALKDLRMNRKQDAQPRFAMINLDSCSVIFYLNLLS